MTAGDLVLPVEGAARPRGLYVHVPFCFHKCHYCDFYSLVDGLDRQQAFVDRLIVELAASAPILMRPLETIFVGGGTPTLLRPRLWEQLLESMREHLEPSPAFEFTVEANPETVTDELAGVLVSGGVNRVSLGAQSFDLRHLKTLERHHDPENVSRSVKILRSAGIDNLNLDLIFGIPGQSIGDWKADLDAAVALEPEHLSCYGLMYEPNTPLTVRMSRGEFTRVDEDAEASMYETTCARLASAGYEHYEISNFCRPGHRSRHNLLYWQNEAWWPLGPSAAGHVAGWRWKNVPRLGEYLDTRDGNGWPPITNVEHLDDDGRAGEVIMLGLRLRDGLPRRRLDELIQQGRRGPMRLEAIARHLDSGMLQWRDESLRLSDRGLLLADTVLADLI